MGLLQRGRDKIVDLALGAIKEKVLNPNIEGIGVVKEIHFKDGQASLTLMLEGLEDRPITITASNIEIAPDGGSITIKNFDSNMPFAKNGLNRFLAGQSFAIPEDSRQALAMAKKVLRL